MLAPDGCVEKWEYLQRKRAKGRELDDYEKGLEKKYEEQQEK